MTQRDGGAATTRAIRSRGLRRTKAGIFRATRKRRITVPPTSPPPSSAQPFVKWNEEIVGAREGKEDNRGRK
ncbi:Protein ARRD-26 [Anopheles sinensis]|uniref:Protein ARRD-26 n=1 Tax=Anopheles sinensis TaxID=74873 RepID=A0A084WT08_ANOSI|nr:Protein ARRD-26 [Anopheles sinensis]